MPIINIPAKKWNRLVSKKSNTSSTASVAHDWVNSGTFQLLHATPVEIEIDPLPKSKLAHYPIAQTSVLIPSYRIP
jgi:hypothetical protein